MTVIRSRRLWLWIIALIGVLVVSVPLAIVAWLFGLFMPLQHAAAERNTAALERALIVGESRVDLERRFGAGLPRPDHRRDYVANTARHVAWRTHASEYSYLAGSEMCFAGYLGVVVDYDAHDRVKDWKRFNWGDGC